MFKSIWDDIVYQFKQGSMVTRLISICVVVFLLFETLHFILWSGGNEVLFYHIDHLFALPSSFLIFLTQPWSAITFMFMHADVWHIFYNMLWLYWFGEIYQLYMRNRRMLPIFVFGSLTGGALIMVLSYIIPPLRATIDVSYTVGASAGIFAIVFAATALNPDHRINLLLIGPVPIKYIAVVSFVLSYVAITHGNAAGEISHIGGAIFGFAYIKSLQSGVDWFTPLDKVAGLFRPKSKLKATYVNSGRNKKDEPSDNEQKRVDAILDKIAKSGYNSLTKEEKDFLFKFSNK
jgi:membrane associated rhomboid family serine protease